ncbi:MAG: YebC/PmpR family DNA-binding transcriptional regulator [Cytophagales bacterium]|nr:YebC/PmpR family DNA-binding transcriptional regulator [Cytophagales bacterium]
MGRAFEYRKARKFKRWDAMSKAFTKYGRLIAMAVKQNGPNPEANAALKIAIQNAKGVSMPKDRIDAAIKRASSKDEKDFEEIVYEGYGPYKVPIIVECATDNHNRTVANIRMYFSRAGGVLATQGALDFLFEKKGVFKLKKGNLDVEELELELIDFGLDSIEVEEEEIVIYTKFTDFKTMQDKLEQMGVELIVSEFQRIPTTYKELSEAEEEEVLELIDTIEQDEDVQNVYHNLN